MTGLSRIVTCKGHNDAPWRYCQYISYPYSKRGMPEPEWTKNGRGNGKTKTSEDDVTRTTYVVAIIALLEVLFCQDTNTITSI